MRLLRFAVPLLLAALVAAGAMAGTGAPAPSVAVTAAERYVSVRYRLAGLEDTFTLRSRRDPRWVLAEGAYARPRSGGLWAAWLRRAGGRWRVVYAGANRGGLEPPAGLRVPCDIRPAFSEPAC